MKKTKITRRHFSKSVAAAGVATALVPNEVLSQTPSTTTATDEYDYIVVGSGAGGGPLAANLAKHGFKVLVLEAGEKDPKSNNYNVPAFHAFASEDPALSWSYFVKHYSGDRDQLDSKYVPGKGILYPRGATIGGSTAVNAMITVYPHANDFEYLAQLTGDDSWSAKNMRKYFSYVEDCQYLYKYQAIEEKHGTSGWLPTNYYNFDVGTLLQNTILLGVITANLDHNGSNLGEYLFNSPKMDVNNLHFQDGAVGPVKIPQTMGKDAKRHAVREYLLATQAQYPDKLIIKTNALVSKVLFDDDKNAIGVEYLEGNNLYKADTLHKENTSATKKVVKAKREVILSAGAFNTPQLLQLSGIGDQTLLQEKGIPVVQHLPGVGKNLQDRYELGVTYKLTGEIADSCSFGEADDPCLKTFNEKGQGVYTTSGSVAANIFKTDESLQDPDIFNFCLASVFNGYYPGYSEGIKKDRDQITWAILKGHTDNTGEVTIQDTNPMNTPNINFKYFNDGTDFNGQDMNALVKAVRNIRTLMTNKNVDKMVEKEVWPGSDYDSDEKLKDIIAKETWGHHASCTCKIGSDDDKDAVLDSNFKVRGVQKLRVVDASIFPKIPGFFIAVPIYLISEKATDVILADAGVSRDQKLLSRSVQQFTANREKNALDRIVITPYPNPTTDIVSFDIESLTNDTPCELTILNDASEIVFHNVFENSTAVRANVHTFPPAIYYYIVNLGNKHIKGKFVKN